MTTSHVDRNNRSRERLQALAGSLDERSVGSSGEGEWNVPTILGHVAFFDRLMLARWHAAISAGKDSPGGLADGVSDLINEAGPDLWGSMPIPVAAAAALRASAVIDGYLADVDPAVVARAIAEDRAAVVDRSIHRNQHLDEIDRLLGRGQ